MRGCYHHEVCDCLDSGRRCKLVAGRATPNLLHDVSARLPSHTLELRGWAANGFMTMDVRRIRDLVRSSRARRLGKQNLGEPSYAEVVRALYEAIEAGPLGIDADNQEFDVASTDEQEPEAATEASNLVSSMWDGFRGLTLREGSVLARRLGIHGRRETLEEIAMTLGVSGERVRQIEAKALRLMNYAGNWIEELDTRVDELRKHLGRPVSLHEAQELDPWFDGVVEYSYVVEWIIRRIYTSKTYIIEIDRIQYFASISQPQWNRILREGSKISSRFRSNEVSSEHYRELISVLLPDCAQEFSEILWDIVHKRRHS